MAHRGVGRCVGAGRGNSLDLGSLPRARPNPRMQPSGRMCPEFRSGAASLVDAAEQRIVRARYDGPQMMRRSLGRHMEYHALFTFHSFHMTDKHENRIPEVFFNDFADPEARRVAETLAKWAVNRELAFEPGEYGTSHGTYYVRVPHALGQNGRVDEYLLTLQKYRPGRNGQLKGQIDLPFRRMKSRAFVTPARRTKLLERVNALLPTGDRIDSSRLGNSRGCFGAISYPLLAAGNRLSAFIEVLDWALAEIRAAERPT